MVGASWVRENILAAYPEADVAVTAIWFNMLFSDDRNEWDPRLLTDTRVTHYWDADRDIGAWFDQNEQQIGFEFTKGPIVWDSFFLFGPDSTWEAVPSDLIAYGNTVLDDKILLREAYEALLQPGRP